MDKMGNTDNTDIRRGTSKAEYADCENDTGVVTRKDRYNSYMLKCIIAVFFLMLLCLASFFLYRKFSAPKYHYEMSEELKISFTNADSVIEQIRKGLQNHDERLMLGYTTDNDHMEDISELVRELMDYALSETDDPAQGDYLRYQYGGYELEYGYEEQNGIYRYSLTITPNYYTTLEQEAKVDELVQEILEGMHFHMLTPEGEKVQKIYDYVYDTVKYDMVHRNNDRYHLKATAYAALVNKRAVCQGYSVLMYRLLREAGVNARIITGTLKDGDGTEYHAWNLVEIDGVYYNLDVTWDKMLETEDYFLKTDESMEDHVRDAEFATDEFYQQYPMAQQDYFNDWN